ncbi:MAG: hypothetical protein P8L37_00710, partial [Phycisphaerales bacterium]|nr:hypothetical protein [Phycisphaerales bacterium]
TIAIQALHIRNLEYQGRLDEAIIPAADLHERLSSTLGEDHADTLQAEGVLNSLYVDSGRWNDVDTIMAIRRTRWDDDPDELVKLTLLISNNTTSDYKERYLDLALDSAQRAVALRGEQDPEMTSNLASVHLARGEHAEAVRWLETTISNAGEEHEEIETYQSTLEQAREQMAAASESAHAP